MGRQGFDSEGLIVTLAIVRIFEPNAGRGARKGHNARKRLVLAVAPADRIDYRPIYNNESSCRGTAAGSGRTHDKSEWEPRT